MDLTRRRFLMSTLFGSGLLGLRSLATGIPISILANPRRALANPPPAPVNAQFVIFSSSANGDPINANVPGMYLDPNIAHSQSPSMQKTPLLLSGRTWQAAAPWASLPQALLDRTCFFHHGTYTVVHADEQKVLQLGLTSAEMYVSMLASQLAPVLGTIQAEPLVLGPRPASEDIIYQGRPQPIISPSALSLLLGPPNGPIGQLTALRDRDLNRLNAFMKCRATPAQGAFLDRYVQSQQQVREVSQNLLSLLSNINDDGPDSQVTAAIVAIQMKIAPVVSINIPFGGDNHGDGGLIVEATQHVSGTQTIKSMWTGLKAAGLQDKVSFLSLNVFGRTLGPQCLMSGRQHNGDHHVAVMFGPGFQGSVVGGVEQTQEDYGAMSIDSATGTGVPGDAGDVMFDQTLQSMALTFGAGIGVDSNFLAGKINGGKIIPAALSAPPG